MIWSFSAGAPLARKASRTKWLLHQGGAVPLADQLASEAFALELSSRTEDFREGMRAFREKRAPEFRGR